MAENRIRELRKNHNLSQEAFSVIIDTTQQTVSRLENGAHDIPSDLLIEMAGFFNVTTDYILGISDVKRDLKGQIRMNREMDQCYDIVLRYLNLSDINQKTFRVILERLEQAQRESNETQKNSRMKEDGKNAQNSDM
ncbi:helix-turn-helix domain-containing protein [Clostridium sp. Marseille-P2415]|uniref:helix-turn-helix domain-containing protein n=1 Tax=Clostridium sp. Marseille-P2415 TaxID=1805471 RepID=UPI000988809C|nr:helix-turn-helix transcriptional regulator [Clostridium sp. Marseille-P2415]